MKDEAKSYLAEGFSKEDGGGVKFRRIRLHNRSGNTYYRSLWLNCLSDEETRSYKALLKRPQLIEALDELIDIPGLWADMRMSRMYKLIGMKCDEVCDYIAS